MQGFLSKPEFFNALVSIGIPPDLEMLSNLFWIFDINGDEMIDSKEFSMASGLFKAYSTDDRIKSS